MKKYRDLLPEVSPEQRRRIRGKQEIICRHEPEKAISTLPQLLSNPNDRSRFLSLLGAILKDPKINMTGSGPTPEQIAMLKRIREVLPDKEMTAAG